MDASDAAPTADLRDLRRTFASGATRSYGWRDRQLHALDAMLHAEYERIVAALREDLGKCDFETVTSETGFVSAEVQFIRKRLKRWIAARRVPSTLLSQPARSEVRPEPLGVVLIIGAWNYPIQLVLAPLAGALAAGNCAVIKPSELAPATSTLLADMLPRYLDADAVRVVEGGIPETTALLAQPWDKIFYTGNGRVARIVMRAAAEHLTPVALELGGKCPVIVDETADLRQAARRIAWAKAYNAGQSCTAPDYVLTSPSMQEDFIGAFSSAIREFYPDGAAASRDYGKIVSERHFDRIVGLLDGQDIAHGGGHSREELFIEPTVLRSVNPSSSVMQEEIFGPVLPIILVEDQAEACRFINSRPKPLAIYAFTKDTKRLERLIAETSSGGMTVGACMLHGANPSLPFGGVGESGMDAYHGEAGFRCFTHYKAIMKKSSLPDPRFVFPPYKPRITRILRRLSGGAA